MAIPGWSDALAEADEPDGEGEEEDGETEVGDVHDALLRQRVF